MGIPRPRKRTFRPAAEQCYHIAPRMCPRFRAVGVAADYWSIGPCFATPTKSDAGPPLGPEGFSGLANRAPERMPVIGIGGITARNAAQISGAGAAGVAVIGAVLSAPEPETAARALRVALAPA